MEVWQALLITGTLTCSPNSQRGSTATWTGLLPFHTSVSPRAVGQALPPLVSRTPSLPDGTGLHTCLQQSKDCNLVSEATAATPW